MALSFTPLTTANLGGSISSITSAIDTNFSTLATLLQDVFSRGGTLPNQLTSNIDMNSFHIMNLPTAATPTEPVRLEDLP